MRPEDADLYTELAGRVDAWVRRRGQADVDGYIEKCGTLNAAVRVMAAAGAL